VGAVSDPPLDPTAIPNEVTDTVAEIRSTPYARGIVTHLSQEQVDRITQVLEDIGAAQWLKANPFTQLELERQVMLNEVPVNGVYAYQTQIAQVATSRNSADYGHHFEWQGVFSVSSTAQTPLEAVQKTLVHELGHHVHSILGAIHQEEFEATLAMPFLFAGTQYGAKRAIEYFPECFSLFIFYPTELLVRDPGGYVMIEKALDLVGLEVRQVE
jgi:hypothetical protein